MTFFRPYDINLFHWYQHFFRTEIVYIFPIKNIWDVERNLPLGIRREGRTDSFKHFLTVQMFEVPVAEVRHYEFVETDLEFNLTKHTLLQMCQKARPFLIIFKYSRFLDHNNM